MRRPITASLLHGLVAGSHAEGTTRLAVAVLIEDDQQILLAETNNIADAFDYGWEPPTDLVLPGETLDDTVCRTAAAAGIHLDHITGYLGHHDLPVDDDIVRTFVFAATVPTGHSPRHSPTVGYRWVTIDDLPDGLDADLLDFIHLAPVDADNPDPLPAKLRAHAAGLPAAEAAIEMLIGHHCWLHRNDFVDHYIATDPGLTTSTPMARVDWPAAITALDTGALASSSREAGILRIAASLAAGLPVNLGAVITGLDSDNLDLVIQAVRHTGRH